MRTLVEDINAAVDYHGHACSGIVLGVRMARLALARLHIDKPLEYRDLIVFVEVDRCLSDAICVVTGCTIGKRRMKLADYGKMAATFYDLATKQAVRAVVTGNKFPPAGENPVLFWNNIPDEDVFTVENVSVGLPPEDLPGLPTRKINCQSCGENILDGREKKVADKVVCCACAGEAYYKRL
ncbi:MAG: FmdE family protein [Desulfotomaculaceae bacterium]|nr:FmdE family protein [Desulfotomaculaceae bacterium]MDD4767223.1 FmdE family protein [Desulfotomaculaceae bacterium]